MFKSVQCWLKYTLYTIQVFYGEEYRCCTPVWSIKGVVLQWRSIKGVVLQRRSIKGVVLQWSIKVVVVKYKGCCTPAKKYKGCFTTVKKYKGCCTPVKKYKGWGMKMDHCLAFTGGFGDLPYLSTIPFHLQLLNLQFSTISHLFFHGTCLDKIKEYSWKRMGRANLWHDRCCIYSPLFSRKSDRIFCKSSPFLQRKSCCNATVFPSYVGAPAVFLSYVSFWRKIHMLKDPWWNLPSVRKLSGKN